ncbi:MAG: DUF2752 domain-containing protein [Candidatus Hydrogenedentes bacterium]|nr:DUF2752 domain-containing protein [Candidatus Hydrogenedentota bacterium]
MRPHERLLCVLAAFGLFCVFLLARYGLTPDPRGVGTHQQLGFPPCLTMTLFGIPCPFCGMTTAFTYMAHGDPVAAFWCQPAGSVVFVAAALAWLASIVFAIRGDWPPQLFSVRSARVLAIIGVLVVLAGWAYKIGASVR